MRIIRLKPKWVVWAAVGLGMILYRAFIYTPDIVRPSRWQASSSAGVRALQAGRLDEAEGHFVAASEEAGGFSEGDSRRGTSLHNIAHLRLRQKRYAEAESLYGQALPLLETGREEHELEVAELLLGLAAVHLARQDWAGAEALIRRAIDINERHRGANDPVVANNLRAYAAVLVAQGRFAESASAAGRAAEIDRSRAGDTPEPPVEPVRTLDR